MWFWGDLRGEGTTAVNHDYTFRVAERAVTDLCDLVQAFSLESDDLEVSEDEILAMKDHWQRQMSVTHL